MKTTCAALALILTILSPAAPDARTIVDRIMATVNGDIITLSEFEKYKAMMLMGAPESPLDVDADRQLLRQLIDKKLILQEAKKLEISVRKKDVENALKEVLRRNKIDQRKLERELTKQGTTIAEYKKVLEGEILQSRTISRAVQSKINISDKEMQEYYEQNMQGMEKSGPRIRIQQILLLTPTEASSSQIKKVKKNTKKLHEKILAGEDFGKLAVENSQGAGAELGGDIGYFYKGELMGDIEEIAFNLDNGQVSPVVRTELGFHIIKVIDKIDSDNAEKTGTWKDRKRDIQNVIYGAKFEQEMIQWMQGLKDRAYIEIN